MAEELIPNFDNLADPSQVATADLSEVPDELFLPIARLVPKVDMERISVSDLVAYLNSALRFGRGLSDASVAQDELESDLRNERSLREQLEAEMAALQERVFNLEHVSPSTPSNPRATGTLAFGLFAADGSTTVGAQDTVMYAGVPSSTRIHFPAALEDNQHWYLQYPQGVIVTHIFNESTIPRVDELDLNPPLWTLDAGIRRYTSLPLSAGFGGTYSIVVATAPSGG